MSKKNHTFAHAKHWKEMKKSVLTTHKAIA